MAYVDKIREQAEIRNMSADELAENIRKPKQDEDIYMSRKMRRRMGE